MLYSGLLPSNASSLIPTDTGCGYRQPRARLGRKQVRPWKWMPFTNPARGVSRAVACTHIMVSFGEKGGGRGEGRGGREGISPPRKFIHELCNYGLSHIPKFMCFKSPPPPPLFSVFENDTLHKLGG